MKAIIAGGGQLLRSMVGCVLDAEGFEVRQAPEIGEARSLLDRGFAPDFVIACPAESGSGQAALRFMKAHPAMKRVPVVLVADKEDLERQMEWKEAGVTCWLAWPATSEQLLEMVRIVSTFKRKKRPFAPDTETMTKNR